MHLSVFATFPYSKFGFPPIFLTSASETRRTFQGGTLAERMLIKWECNPYGRAHNRKIRRCIIAKQGRGTMKLARVIHT